MTEKQRAGWLSRLAPGVRKVLGRRDTPDELWIKCPATGDMVYRPDVEAALWVTPAGHHLRLDLRRCDDHLKARQKSDGREGAQPVFDKCVSPAHAELRWDR